MRTFVAIELADNIQQALAQTLRALRAATPPMRLKWVAPENQHLTLQFLGEVSSSAVNDIAQALAQAVVGIAPFEITLAAIGCFPNSDKPNILWVGVREPSDTLQKLYKAVGAQLGRIGYPPDARAFAPHLTLARVPRDTNTRERKRLGEWFMSQLPPEPQSMRVTQVHLMQSELLPAGARYTALRVIALSA